MKKMFAIMCFAFAVIFCRANNVQITSLTTTVTGSVTNATFTIQWDNSWRGGPAGNYDAVWVFLKYSDDMGFWKHLDVTNTGNILPANLAIDTTSDHKGFFIYRSSDGTGNITASTVTVGIQQQPGIHSLKIFGIEMVYVPKGPFYAGYSINTGQGFGDGNAQAPYLVNSAIPPSMGTSAGQLYDSRGNYGILNPLFPTGYNAFYIMKYELSQAGYRDFLNTPCGYSSATLQAHSDLTAANYSVPGTKLFPAGYRNSLYVSQSAFSDPVGANANGNTVYNEADDGEWVAANYLYWSDAAAFLDWAALRPMTELEYEKAANGPAPLSYIQFATGTYISMPGVAPITGAFTNAESVTFAGSTNNINVKEAGINAPLRSGWAATASSNRKTSGASYYGVMDLTGNLWEPVVTTANAAGRSFSGKLGDGSLDGYTGLANTTGWPGVQNTTTLPNGSGQILRLNTAGLSKKGGSFLNLAVHSTTTDVFNPAGAVDTYPTTRAAAADYGCRGVRQQTSGAQ